MDQLSSDLASLRIDRNKKAAESPRNPERNPERRSGLWRFLIGMMVLAALAAGGVLAYPMLEAQVFKQEVQVTEILEISPAQASTSLKATGYVVAQRISKVGSKIPGRISKVLVKEGDLVRAGDVLFELDAADQRSAIAAARSRVFAAQARAAAARAGLAEIRVQAQRQQVLVDRQVAPRSNVEDLQARIESLQAQVAAADAEVRAAQSEVEVLRVGMDQMTVLAPIDGTIITKPAELGEMLIPELPGGAEALTIADLRSLVVEIDVPEDRLHLVRVGGPCEIVLDAFPGRRYRGSVQELGRRVDRAKATVPVKVRFEDPMDSVLPDMAARVSFLTQQIEAEALRAPAKVVVPASAVATRGGRKVVFVIEEGKVRAEPVTLGPRSQDGFEIVDGPTAGTRVVDHPSSDLSSGQRIKENKEE